MFVTHSLIRSCPKLVNAQVQRHLSAQVLTSPNEHESQFEVPVNISNPHGLARLPSVYSTPLPPICGQLYRQYREAGWKRYSDVPAQGLDITAQYFDNVIYVGQSAPVKVLMLPGVPGNFTHFAHIIEHLTNQGVRVVAPSFPDMKFTKQNKWFRHSPVEKTEYLKSLLEVIGEQRFDILLSHSSGSYTAIGTWADPRGPRVGSLIFLNPCGIDMPLPSPHPLVTMTFVKAYETKFGAKLIDQVAGPVAKQILALLGNSFTNSDVEDSMHGLTHLHYADSARKKMGNQLRQLRNTQLPTTVIYSETDRVVGVKMTRKVLNVLGADSNNEDVYDKQGRLDAKGWQDESDWLKVIRFQSGGHFSFQKFPTIINKAVSLHLSRLQVNKSCN